MWVSTAGGTRPLMLWPARRRLRISVDDTSGVRASTGKIDGRDAPLSDATGRSRSLIPGTRSIAVAAVSLDAK